MAFKSRTKGNKETAVTKGNGQSDVPNELVPGFSPTKHDSKRNNPPRVLAGYSFIVHVNAHVVALM